MTTVSDLKEILADAEAHQKCKRQLETFRGWGAQQWAFAIAWYCGTQPVPEITDSFCLDVEHAWKLQNQSDPPDIWFQIKRHVEREYGGYLYGSDL